MRQFYIQFPIWHAVRAELNWMHYCYLIRVENQETCEIYTNEIANNQWSTHFIDKLMEADTISKHGRKSKSHTSRLKPFDLIKMIRLSFVIFLFISVSLFAETPPPGTVPLSKDGIKYIDVNEITVSNWKEFLYWIEKLYGKESAEYKAMLPDNTIIQNSLPDWEHPSYTNYPMTGLSYEQAMKYCKWRTDRVNEFLVKNGKNYKVSYSLPSEGDFQEAWKQQKVKTNQKEVTFIKDGNKELINVADNVHEITSGKTVLKGDISGTLQFEPYQSASSVIGFRCIAEIVK